MVPVKEVLQRQKFIVGLVMIVGTIAVSTLAAVPTRKSAVVRFTKPTFVAGAAVIGPVVIEHDDEKMASGGDCTAVYHFDATTKRAGKAIVTFMCVPRERPLATTFHAVRASSSIGPERLVEYQFAGDTEGHGIPDGK